MVIVWPRMGLAGGSETDVVRELAEKVHLCVAFSATLGRMGPRLACRRDEETPARWPRNQDGLTGRLGKAPCQGGRERGRGSLWSTSSGGAGSLPAGRWGEPGRVRRRRHRRIAVRDRADNDRLAMTGVRHASER
jgi:hypothetical protein